MLRHSLFAAVAAVACTTAAAHAGSVLVTAADWTGSRSTPAASGLYSQGGWATSGFVLSWNITFDGTKYTYVYTVEGGTNETKFKDISHFVLETSPTFTASDLLAGSSTPLEGPKSWPADDAGNPDMPADLYGVKFDFGGKAPVSYTLVTTRAPIWGDFYAKDGKTGGVDNVAYNIGFGTDPTALTTNFTAWIPTPDTVGFGDPNDPNVPIPLPSAAFAGGALLAFLGVRQVAKSRR